MRGSDAGYEHFRSGVVDIRYLERGEGESVLLLHGFFVDVDSAWLATGVFSTLSQDRRAIAFDLRGHGGSGKPHDSAAYGIEMALDAVRLLDHLQIGTTHLVGYSMGGEIVLKLLELAPERFRSAVLGGAGWMRRGDFKHESWRLSAETLAGVKPGESIMAHFAPSEDQRPSKELQAIIDGNDPRALAGVARGMLELTVHEETLRRNRIPTLALFGEKDWVRPTGEAMEGVMADLTLEIVPALNHEELMVSEEFPRRVQAFLETASMPSSGLE